ncbi:MAG: RNA-binding domain-containing protein [Candidatus Hydrogenedentales bacterium]
MTEKNSMSADELRKLIDKGEDSTLQFKADITNGTSLAAEMSAFANSEGGIILVGVANDGTVPGLSRTDVGRINQLISNTASQSVRSPLAVNTENVLMKNGRVVIVLTVPKGIDKPYFDKNGVIWLKVGSDKRRVNSKEELRRLFQVSDQFHADELPTKAGVDKLDKLRFRDFLRDLYKQEYPDSRAKLTRLLQNMNLATANGKLNLAGVLLFAEQPEFIVPQFVVKAIRYPRNEIHATDYVDTEDFSGPLAKIFEDTLAFIMRNLYKVQAGRGINTLGLPEVPERVFEELLVNALAHRDYLINAPIRLFVFDNRIEIISPGHLPNNLTVAKIRIGISNIRNPILVSYIAKGLLPYHGLGSGIKRALDSWPNIDFTDDHDRDLFIATVHRKPLAELRIIDGDASTKASVKNRDNVGKESIKRRDKTDNASVKRRVSVDKASVKERNKVGKTSVKILEACRENRAITIPELALLIGITERSIERNIQSLRERGLLRRVGGRKEGHWEVVD